MTKKFIVCLVSFILPLFVFSQSQLVKNLSNKKKQTVVVYGTSLSSGSHGQAWMGEVARQLNEKYGDHLNYFLAGKGGMWSTWGVQHLEDSVIKKNPDVVIIEFGINDAFMKYNTSPKLARLNLEYMIKRIRLHNQTCEVVLQIMNMPVGKSASFRPDLKAYYNMYRNVAKKEKLLLIDHYPNWQKILNLGEDKFLKHVPDGIHPNEESGRKIIAPFIIRKLEGK
jgi:lysophospholipase L1-like esterase